MPLLAMDDFLQLGLVVYLGWRLILEKGENRDHIPSSLKAKHFVAWVFICFFCLDLGVLLFRLVINLKNLELTHAGALKIFDPTLSVLIDFLGAGFGTFCLVLCYGAAVRNRRALQMLRRMIPVLATYYGLAEFRALYERGHNSIVIGLIITIAIGIPTALLLRFYYRRENFTLLSDENETGKGGSSSGKGTDDGNPADPTVSS